jgi:osmoprotectant transport system permease protein
MRKIGVLLILALAGCAEANPRSAPIVRVGSKKFTESVILAEMAADLAEDAGSQPVRRHQLGGTQVLWKALLQGAVDIYPEYTGTISQEILAGRSGADVDSLSKILAEFGVRISRSLGFNDTYAIGMKETRAQELGIHTVSDLRRHPDLRFGFSSEFMKREDGWPGLREGYRLPQSSVRGLDHDLAYVALENGNIDVTDIYSTDAEIEYHKLIVLKDDLDYFPPYEAVFLYRDDLEQRAPEALKAILQLEGRINAKQMTEMNARAKRASGRVPAPVVAADFLNHHLGLIVTVQSESVVRQIMQRTGEHLSLVGISLAAALLIALPLGVVAARRPAVGQVLLAAAGILQTIPSLALFVFLIPLLGLGALPAIVALFLYSLLPILRNTYTGLREIPLPIRESAEALGMPASARLWRIELPMASPTILAGIKTSAVINVGTATLGAIIGTGGYGEPIMTGIMLNDIGLILQGAVPAALMALGVQGLFDLAERALVPKGLRLRTQT